MLRVDDAYGLSVSPWVAGRTLGWGPYDDPAHRDAVLDSLVALHTTTGCRERADRDDLGQAIVTGLRALVDDPGAAWDAGPFSRPAWDLVAKRGGRLRVLLDRHQRLARGAHRHGTRPGIHAVSAQPVARATTSALEACSTEGLTTRDDRLYRCCQPTG